MIEQILKNSAYKLTQFSKNEIAAVEQNIYQKPNGKIYIKCLIREREIQLKPEEVIRQLFIYKLLNAYGYPKSQIKVEHGINFGREVKRADIVIVDKNHADAAYIIIEIKRPNIESGEEQLKSYCKVSLAPIAVWTNGEKIAYWTRQDKNIFIDIPDIPNANQTLEDMQTKRWYIPDLVENDVLSKGNTTLSKLIRELEDEVLANAGVDAFEEVFKLIFAKLYDEYLSTNDEQRYLYFRNYNVYKEKEEKEVTDKKNKQLETTIQELFNAAKKEWAGVFAANDKIELTPSHLVICISKLQNVKLFNSNLEVIDEAFEHLMNKSQKGEKGQYFTPRYVIDMCVKMLNPKRNETMIDTAAGSCGFPVHTIFHVCGSQFSAKKKSQDNIAYVRDNIFAIDFDEKAVRVARTLNLIAGDGKTNVIRLNTLDYKNWTEVVSDKAWQKKYSPGWLKLDELRAGTDDDDYQNFNFDILMANPPFAGDVKEKEIIQNYELAQKSNGTYQTKIGRDILFIERNLQFLKPGGRMAIVLPQGRFNNSSDKYIRDFISERCRILAIVGLHGNVFKPHTGTKTSVLFVQKWDDTLCPRQDDYKIFFATMLKPSKDNSGEKIYVANSKGLLRDNHGHLIVDHDLFNHDGLTQDGIAEAFADFAKKEKLSFFDSSSFNEQHYRRLLEGLECTEILLSDLYDDNFEHRLDSEFILKRYLKLEKILTANKFFKIKDFAAVTDGIHESIIFDDDSNINLISAKAPKENYFDLSGTGFISKIQHDENPRTALKENDVIISTVGTIGNCAVVNSEILPANSDRHVGIVRIQKDFCPRYLSTFLLSKFGRYQTERNTTGNVQPNLFIYKIKEIKVPFISKNFQLEIENFVLNAENLKKSADETYRAAEKLLAQELHLEDFKPSTKNTAEVSFSAFMQAGRLDAEYFMPKYDDIENKLASEFKIKDKFKLIKTTCDRTKDFYKYIEIGDVNVSNGVATSNLIATEDLPDNAKIMTKAGDVLVSKVRPNRGAVAVLTENNLLVSGAFAVLRECGDFSKNVLQVLLRLKVYRELMLKFNVGSSYPVIKDEDVLNLPLPKIDAATQTEIAALVEKSFALRAESGRLLEEANLAVEMAIESGETVAIKYLRGGNIGD